MSLISLYIRHVLSPVLSVAGGAALLCVAGPAQAQGGAPGAMSQLELPQNGEAAQLSGYLARLATNPRDFEALVGAGEAALAMGDDRAAVGFFGRADDVVPNNGRVKAGLGRALLALDQPGDALRLLEQAGTLGYSDPAMLSDRGLARDLDGDQPGAQKDYQAALAKSPKDSAIIRRYAVSLGISGQVDLAEKTIQPLLYGNDRGAWRDRAFILAMNGRRDQARTITTQVMPKQLADAIQPYMERMPMLTSAQRAAAVHKGKFPPGLVTMRMAANMAAPAAQPRTVTPAAPARPAPTTATPVTATPATSTRATTALTQAAPATATTARQPAPRTPADTPNPSVRAPVQGPMLSDPYALPQRGAEPARQAGVSTNGAMGAARVAVAEPVRVGAVPSGVPPVIDYGTDAPAAGSMARPATPSVAAAPTPTPTPMPAPMPAPAPVATAPAPMPAPAPVATAPAAFPAPAPVAPAPAVAGPVTASASVTALASAPSAPVPSTPASSAPAPVAPSPVPAAEPEAQSAPPSSVAVNRTLADIMADVQVPDAEKATSAPPVDLAEIAALQAAKRKAQLAADTKAKKDAAAKAKAAEIAAEKAAELAEKKRLAANPARIWVQVGTGRDKGALAFTLRSLRKQYADTMGKRDGWTAEWGRTNRLVVGPFATMAKAKSFEADMKKAGTDAFLWQSDAGEEVTALGSK